MPPLRPVVKFDQWSKLWCRFGLTGSNVQVRAGLSALHQAIDRAVLLDDQHASRNTGGGSGADSEKAQQGPDSALEASVAPAPAAADLVYASVPSP